MYQLHNYLLDDKIIDCISAHLIKIIFSQKRRTREDANNRKHAKLKRLINVHAYMYVCVFRRYMIMFSVEAISIMETVKSNLSNLHVVTM